MEHPLIDLLTKRIMLNFLLKLSDVKSDLTLTLGYLNPAENNRATGCRTTEPQGVSTLK